jgi:hypothetical protein
MQSQRSIYLLLLFAGMFAVLNLPAHAANYCSYLYQQELQGCFNEWKSCGTTSACTAQHVQCEDDAKQDYIDCQSGGPPGCPPGFICGAAYHPESSVRALDPNRILIDPQNLSSLKPARKL